MKGKTGGHPGHGKGKKRAAGGSIPPMAMKGPQAYKHGGAVGGMKSGGRLDKRARGGRMTPSSPLSGAGNMKGQPYESGGVPATTACGKGGDDTEHDRARGGRLTAEARRKLPDSDFALPGRGSGPGGKGSGAYPIDSPGRARAALSRGSANADSAEQATIRRRVHAKYPGIKVSGE